MVGYGYLLLAWWECGCGCIGFVVFVIVLFWVIDCFGYCIVNSVGSVAYTCRLCVGFVFGADLVGRGCDCLVICGCFRGCFVGGAYRFVFLWLGVGCLGWFGFGLVTIVCLLVMI